VTGRTVTGHIGVIEVSRNPARRGMAISTNIGTGDVSTRFSGGDIAIVATRASANHIGMVDLRRWRPGTYPVTALTDLSRLDMTPVLASGRGAVMAAGTVTADASMIVGAGTPGDSVVAILAWSAVCRDMCRRLASGYRPVMAADTAAVHRRVVNANDLGPTEGGVTKFAAIVRLYMAWVLAGTDSPVVAVAAATRDISVIETGSTPGGGSVAVSALIIALHMIWVFAFRSDTVVAAFAVIGRAGEQPIEMAAIALNIAVPASQWEASGKMIKFTDRRIGHRALQSDEGEQQPGKNEPSPEGASMLVVISCCTIHSSHSGLMLCPVFSEKQVP
jgi:hypothetical protein